MCGSTSGGGKSGRLPEGGEKRSTVAGEASAGKGSIRVFAGQEVSQLCFLKCPFVLECPGQGVQNADL